MPETIQGQFEKRVYLNTRIKTGSTFSAEEPHGLAFVEELKNNYITEVPDQSLTLGSSDGRVSVLIEGPASISGGLALPNYVPAESANRLYNNNGELYWDGSKVGSDYQYISENDTVLNLGPASSTPHIINIRTLGSLLIDGPNSRSYLSIGPNGFCIDGDNINIISSSITIGPNVIEKTSSAFILGPDDFIHVKVNRSTKNPTDSRTFNGPALSLSKEQDFQFESVTFEISDLTKSICFKGPLGNIKIWPTATETVTFDGPAVWEGNSKYPSTFIVGPVQVNNLPTAFVNQDTDHQRGKAVVNLNNNLYYATPNHSMGTTGPVSYYDFHADSNQNQKINMSYINVPYQYVDDDHKGADATLENNTIYIFDPDHDVDLSDVKIKHWNTPQLHLYFNNEVSGKTKMTFTYPETWKWINETTPPTDSDFTAGHMYCITLRSLQNPVYDSSSDTPPFNEEYIVIANIAYDVAIDERTASNT